MFRFERTRSEAEARQTTPTGRLYSKSMNLRYYAGRARGN